MLNAEYLVIHSSRVTSALPVCCCARHFVWQSKRLRLLLRLISSNRNCNKQGLFFLTEMVISCWVRGCANRANGTDKLGFYSIPRIREHEGDFTKSLSEERRRLWLASINRKDEPTKYSKICSDHFITGRPASIYERCSPDWAPTLKLGEMLTPTKSLKKQAEVETKQKRFQRVVKRQETKERHHAARCLLELHDNFQLAYEDPISPEEPDCHKSLADTSIDIEASNCSIPQVTQNQVDSEIQRLLSENMMLRAELESLKLTQDSFQDNNEKVKYYTGLPNFETLMLLFSIVSPFLCTKNMRIGVFERLLMTLMRLKLNLPVKDLAYRFNTSTSTVSRIFLIVIHILFVRLGFLIYWPEREELRKTMPMEFQTYFSKKTAVIIDCFEIFIQRPTGLMARAQTWSNYKHQNTVKYLIGITPQGSISFISDGWGGRASDKFITEECGILNKLLPGDLVLADRGFDISDSVGLHCAEINVPAFTRGKPQLSATDVETTRRIAHVRIHVERVIGLVRNKYTILQGKLPIDYLMSEGGVPAIDKITTVCCALTNMCESVVGFD